MFVIDKCQTSTDFFTKQNIVVMSRSIGIVNLCSREAETGDHHRKLPKH